MTPFFQRNIFEARDIEAEIFHPAAFDEGSVVDFEALAPAACFGLAIFDAICHFGDFAAAVEANACADGDDDHHVVGVAEELAAFVEDVADGVVLGGAVVN